MSDPPHPESADAAAEAELEQLLAASRALPAEIDPPRDLWPGIEHRLHPRTAADAVADRRSDSWLGATGWPAQLAAAIALLIAGGVLSQLWWPASSRSMPVAVGLSADAETLGDARWASAEMPATAQLAVAEAEYLRAKEALWLAVYRNRDQLSPVTMRVVERNLRVIDRAIEDLREALEDDPGDQRLQGLLYANHRRGIDLLQRLAQSSKEI